MTTEANPRARLRLLQRGDADRIARGGVLPPSLEERLAEAPELQAWRVITGRREEARARLARLQAELERAKEADARSEHQAAFSAKPEKALPRPKAGAVLGRVEEEERRVAYLDRKLLEVSRELLAAAVPHLDEATEQAAKARDEADEQIDGLLVALRTALERRVELGVESGWLDGLLWNGATYAWGAVPHGGRLSPVIGNALLGLQATVEEEREKARGRRAQVERERAQQFDGPGRPKDLTPSAPTPEPVRIGAMQVEPALGKKAEDKEAQR
jgi:hypothetical protein